MADKRTEAFEFVMSFVASSEKYKNQFEGKWREILANFMVDFDDLADGRGARGIGDASPYRGNRIYKPSRNNIRLKDPETHRLVMTYASKLVRSMLGDPKREYVQASGTGYEDAVKAATVTRLLRYDFGLPGMFRTFVESIVDMLLFGTSVVEVGWRYEEREMAIRSVESQFGIETSTSTRMKIPVYDDVSMTPVDISCFYPDPSRYRIQDMAGAAKQFRMTAAEARRMARAGVYDPALVEQAIGSGVGNAKAIKDSFRIGLDQPYPQAVSAFGEMIGYEYSGEVVYGTGTVKRERVTLLNGVNVRMDDYDDYYLPFHSFTINPVQGRFYGISPAEVVRSDQSFADAIKILLAEAVIRQVHPPIAFDSDSDFDRSALKEWRADLPIGIRGGPSSIGTLRYDANVQSGFAMLTGLKQSIQEASGALGGIQGENGPDRESATGASQRIQMALDRPELAGMLIESDTLPCIGSAFLRLNQRFILDTDDLKKRIGEQPDPVWIGDIMGDFDVQFFGSRQITSRQEKLQSYDRLTAMASAIPNLMVQIPWDQIARNLVGDLLDLPDVAAKMQDPQAVALNMMMAQALGPGAANGNGQATAPEPTGMLPAQASGA